MRNVPKVSVTWCAPSGSGVILMPFTGAPYTYSDLPRGSFIWPKSPLTPVDTNALVGEILASMHSTVSGSGARVEVGPLPIVTGDRNAIGQVFANIIGNALKSFDASRPGVVQISATGGQTPIFAIRDNGVGIPPEYQPKIFQVFQHVHANELRGEGMGLAIVRRIIERHGGAVWFESLPGSGTTFYFQVGSAAGDPARGRSAVGEQGV